MKIEYIRGGAWITGWVVTHNDGTKTHHAGSKAPKSIRAAVRKEKAKLNIGYWARYAAQKRNENSR